MRGKKRETKLSDAQIQSHWDDAADRLLREGHLTRIDGRCPIFYRNNLRFPLYRYTHKQRAEDFFKEGKLRLTPLLNYRKIENFNEAIGDKGEGQTNFVTTKFSYPVGYSVSIRNQLTICLSEDRNDATMMKEFDADCCFRVNSLDFFVSINKQIEDRCDSCLIDRVAYIPASDWAVNLDNHPSGGPLFAGLFKREKHAYQKEVRSLWEVKGYSQVVPAIQASRPLRPN